MTVDEKYMKQAIKQAKKAYAIDEVPIGCVIVMMQMAKSLPVVTTVETQTKIPYPMRN